MNNFSLDKLMKGLPVAEVTCDSIIAEVSAQLVLKRAESKMTQEDFAKHLGFSQSTLSKYENGIENLTVKKLAELLSKLNLSAELVCRHQENQSYQPRETVELDCRDHGNSVHKPEGTIVPTLYSSSKLKDFGVEIEMGGIDEHGKELWMCLKAS